jgi:hypothetical protein
VLLMPAFVLNTNALDLLGLKSHTEGVFLDDATVTFTIQDKSGVEAGGVTWPQVMTYVDGSQGDYQGIVPAATELAAGKQYYAIIDAQGGGERLGHWEMPFKPVTRTGLPEGTTNA